MQFTAIRKAVNRLVQEGELGPLSTLPPEGGRSFISVSDNRLAVFCISTSRKPDVPNAFVMEG